MSSAKSKSISEIDLEEFERRMRVVRAPQAGVEDPLSELTRLVNTIAAERPQTEKVVDIASARMLKSEPFPNAHQLQRGTQAPSLRDGAAPPPPPVAQPAPAPVAPAARVMPAARVLKPAAAAAPATLPNRAAAMLRASFDETPVPVVEHPDSGAAAIAAATQDEEAPAHEYFARAPLQAGGDRSTFARPPRRGSWYLKVAGLTAVSLLMVGGAVAMKIGMPGLHKSPPLIRAADGPSKLAPPNEATVQSAGDTSALRLKDSAPEELVSTEEQPVDLLAQTPAPAPKPPAADAQPAPTPNSPAADGQLAPAPNTPIVAPSEGLGGAPAPDRTLFPSAKQVKTVSIRPDGTLISSDTAPDAPVAQSPAPAPSPAPVAPVRKPENAGAAALAATPTIDLPAKPAPKSSARMNIAKPATHAPADSANAPQLGLGTHAAKPVRPPPQPKPVAVADAATPTQLNLLDLLGINKPAQTQAPAIARSATPAVVTAMTPRFETPSAGGGWAVQLAGARSESEAQATLSGLQNKYGSDLGSAPLSVHKAEVNGEAVYRVRAGGLSKADAHSLCTKLKASGGECFVARNT